MISGSLPGDERQASPESFPAAATTTAPDAAASLAAASIASAAAAFLSSELVVVPPFKKPPLEPPPPPSESKTTAGLLPSRATYRSAATSEEALPTPSQFSTRRETGSAPGATPTFLPAAKLATWVPWPSQSPIRGAGGEGESVSMEEEGGGERSPEKEEKSGPSEARLEPPSSERNSLWLTAIPLSTT